MPTNDGRTSRILCDSPGVLDKFEELALGGCVRGALIHDARIAAVCLVGGVRELWTVTSGGFRKSERAIPSLDEHGAGSLVSDLVCGARGETAHPNLRGVDRDGFIAGCRRPELKYREWLEPYPDFKAKTFAKLRRPKPPGWPPGNAPNK